MSNMTIAKAINLGLRRALQADPKVLIAGEDVRKLGGVFRITEGLQAEFGTNRVIDSPLVELGIIGTAVGLTMRGYRVVAEIQFDGFVFPAFGGALPDGRRGFAGALGRASGPDRRAALRDEFAIKDLDESYWDELADDTSKIGRASCRERV